MNISDELSNLLGPSGWLTGRTDIAPHSRDWLDRYGVLPIGMARPASDEETAAVLNVCHEHQISVVPQGGRTGLVGASVPVEQGSVLLSMSRLNRIERIDATDFTATVGAGVVLETLHETLVTHDLQFPLHLGSGGSAQIGGLIATNAGGSHAFRHGMMQDLVLGLDVVLPDGRIWRGTRGLIKDNSGFQLRKLFCGSEGRLGVVTKAALRLCPAPRRTETVLIAFRDFQPMREFSRQLRAQCHEFLTALEFFDDEILGLTLRNIPELRWPMAARAPFYLLAEMSSTNPELDLDTQLERQLEKPLEAGFIADAVLAQSGAQREQIWRIREELPEGTLREGRQLKHDISVPISQIAEFLKHCAPGIQAILPGARIWIFGHLGDGNIHYNVSPPKGETDFSDRDAEINLLVYRTAEEHGGSFAAEHGIGRSKMDIADQIRSPTERDLMGRIRTAFDPDNRMNPGIIVR